MKRTRIFVVIIYLLFLSGCQPPVGNELEPNRFVPLEAEGEGELATPMRLPLAGFIERWNALASEQGSTLTLSQLEENEDGRYSAHLTNQIELHLLESEEKVQRLLIMGEGESEEFIYSFLTAASQAILILTPDGDMHDVNLVFHQLGVRPDGVIDSEEDQPILSKGIHYSLSTLDNHYVFEASY